MGEKSGKNVRRQHIKRVFMDNKRNIFIYALQKTIPVMVGYLFLGMAYGISMLEKYSGTGSRKPYLIFGLTDETFSVICAEKVPEHMDRGKLYMLITLFDQCYWVLGTLLGCAAGRLVTFNSTGLDFALTALAAGTILTRFLPFLLFPTAEKTPPFVTWLGEKLPYASMGLLVVYCLKDISITTGSHGIPECAAVALTAILQVWKKNVLLSIGVGTVCYMLLVQFVFL